MPEHSLGVPIEFHDRLASTNDRALERADEGAPEGLVVRTREQVAGRGRQGRGWWGSRDASIAFSLLLRPSIPVDRFPLFTMAMAAAVAETGRSRTGSPLGVKWPNDVVHGGRKLCGILAEGRAGAGAPILVVGVGVNVNQTAGDFPNELRARATSLRLVRRGPALDVDGVFAEILERFATYVHAARSGGGDALHALVIPWLPQRGAPLRVRSGDRDFEGCVEGIEPTGALRLREPGGAVVTVAAGEIR